MGKKRQKVRWLSIDEGVKDSSECEEERMSLSPSEMLAPTRVLEKSSCYARRPVAPRFERKAAAAEILYESSRSYRGRELSGESSEELPLGFTKIRSKNLDVLFKRDYYSTKGGLNSEANTHSETSSLTQKEDEKEEEQEIDVEEEIDEEEEEFEEEEREEEDSSNTKKESVPKRTTSKLNGSSSPFYPSSPQYVMSMHPYMTGRPNLFLYSPSSNTMIPCEEVVVPGMFPGSPSSPQNVYLAAFPMDGSHPYMMAPSYPPPYYPQHPVYSDAEPSSAESTLPHSPPELSAFNPAYWGDHSQRGGYVHGYHCQTDPSYVPLEGVSPKQTPEKMPVVPELEDKKEEETDSNALEVRRVPGLPPQPKKSQKKKRKKKNKNTSELVHRNSTSSEEGRTLDLLKEESAITINADLPVSSDSNSKKSQELPISPLPLEEILDNKPDLNEAEAISEKSPVIEEALACPLEEKEAENNKTLQEQPPCHKEKEMEVSEAPVASSTVEESFPEEEDVGEKSSDLALNKQVEETPKDEVNDKMSESNPRMLYSSVVSQSMPKSPSPSTSSSSKAVVIPSSPPSSSLSQKSKEPLPVSTSLDNLKPADESDSGEWLESSSRKKIKRQRQSKKSSKYSSLPSSPVIRSMSLESSSQVKENANSSTEGVIELSRSTSESLNALPSSSRTTPEREEEQVEEEAPKDSTLIKSNELAEERILSNLDASSSKKSLNKKKKNKRRDSSSSKVSNPDTTKKQVLICDGAIDVSSSFSSLKSVSDIGCLRLHSRPLGKGSVGLDTLFISDVGLGIRNGPIMSGRPLRCGKYNPPDRAGEILSMKASLASTSEENAQYMSLD